MSKLATILLVTSDPAVAQLLDQPAAASYKTEIADSTAKGLRSAEKLKPAVALISEQLPDGSGLALAGKLAAQTPLMHTILISPEDSVLSVRQVLSAGISDWLRQPLQPDAVWQAVGLTLRKRQQQQSWIKQETKRTTGSLEKRVNELDTILTQIQDGVIVIAENGTVMMVNHIARRAFGLDDEVLAGKQYQEVFRNRDLLMAIRGESPDLSRIEIEAEDKTFYRATRREMEGIGVVVSLHDISYLKELNRMKTEFVNTVSHDLRSPLTSILGYVELIRRAGEVNRQQAEYITVIQDSVHQITKLINEVLDLGKIESRVDKEFTEVSLTEIAKDVLVNMKPMIQESGNTLVTDLDQSLPLILGDEIQLRQMIENLVGNAVKYTPAGGVIEVKAARDNELLIFKIKDTGRGIPLEEQKRVFEPFYRGQNVSEDTQGTGLGLAITKTVIDNHRGRIWLDSNLDQGSTFTIMLPIITE